MIKTKYCFVLVCLLLQACTTASEHFDLTANDYRFDILTVKASKFNHRLYINAPAQNHQGNTLHVYLDGDGSPWFRNKWISQDPTSRHPLILDLMKQDTAPAVMLGRPCYHQAGPERFCDNRLWTSHRYNREIVESMALGLNHWLTKNRYDQLILIGYSGGGSLAMLMAPYLDDVDAIITLCANLNTTKWSHHHGLQALSGSLNPAEQPTLPTAIRQFHIAGDNDAIVPARIVKTFAQKQNNAVYLHYPEKHHCCWQKRWKTILEHIEKQ